ncbi:MAG TPA: type II toxin-antitoxin system prevent-host-death family antitoxin [Stellaceae bacterium]|jgi:prevent-host-death family protein|nr:type II toxin-antitoxin system prevent-host-death family antitoxin [Stellaceae bacterium]
MSKTITLRDANQRFSRCVREVEAGEEFVITRKGEPVARLIPAGGKRILTAEQEAALARIAATDWPLDIRKFDRNEIYQERIDRYRGR